MGTTFIYQYSDLIMLLFKQISIVALLIIAFNFETEERGSINPVGYIQEKLVNLMQPTAPPANNEA
jgi:hypothetical protein